MRKAFVYIVTLAFAGCDSGFDPVPLVEEVRFTIDAQVPDRAIPGAIQVSANCSVTVGGLRDSPEGMTVTVDGRELANVPGSSVEVEATLSIVGLHTVVVECRFENESDSFESSVDVVEPAQVTVHLRNFTQDGEPFVRNEGSITFTVGDSVRTSHDSVTVYVVPDAEHEIFAGHPDFLTDWALIVNSETGETLEFRDRSDRSSPVHISSDVSIDVFKIRESDVTSLSNRYLEPWQDTSPFYTVDNLRRALIKDSPIGGTNRIMTDKLTVWTGGISLDEKSGVFRAIQQLLVTAGPDHVSTLTGGQIQTVDVSDSRERPNAVQAGCIIEVRYQTYAQHEEYISIFGAIWQANVKLPATSSTGTAMTHFLHAIGLRGTLGYSALDDYVDGLGGPSDFAKLALKILYASPPGSRP